MRHAVEMFVDLHVVIDVYFCFSPRGKLEPIKWKGAPSSSKVDRFNFGSVDSRKGIR